VEGETREEALEKLKTEAESRLKAGAEIVTVDIDGAIYALPTFAAFSSLLTRWRRGKPSQSPSREP
jgi:hypothetical protein